jgi:hypothetical protein
MYTTAKPITAQRVAIANTAEKYPVARNIIVFISASLLSAWPLIKQKNRKPLKLASHNEKCRS